MSWSRRFEDPVILPDGRELAKLRQAGNYLMALTGKTRQSEHWLVAAEALLMAAEGRGPLMHARIAMLRALNHGRPAPVSEPRRKRQRSYRIIR